MKKKCILVLLTFVPLIMGEIVSATVLNPKIGMFIFNVFPLVTSAFWVFLGVKFAHTNWNALLAIIIGNSTGIVSLLLYLLWSFVLQSDETISSVLAFISQKYFASVPWQLTKLAIFIRGSDVMGRELTTTIYVVRLIYMILIFSVAFLVERYRMNYSNIKTKKA